MYGHKHPCDLCGKSFLSNGGALICDECSDEDHVRILLNSGHEKELRGSGDRAALERIKKRGGLTQREAVLARIREAKDS